MINYQPFSSIKYLISFFFSSPFYGEGLREMKDDCDSVIALGFLLKLILFNYEI